MIRILHYVPAFGYGGIESFVMNLYNNIDRSKIQFDFLVEADMPDNVRQEILNLGGNVYKIPKMTASLNIFKYLKALKGVFSERKWVAFHCHSLQTRPFPMLYAKAYGIKIRILHIHSNKFNNGDKGCFKNFVQRLLLNFGARLANTYVACSKSSANSMLPSMYKDKAYVLNNAIELDKYKFSEEYRKVNRSGVGEKTVVLGIIGRLSYLKNQKYILELLKRITIDYNIWIIGDGEYRTYLEENYNTSNIKYFGNINNVNEVINAIDLLLVPSMSEGLPLTILEAQANGLPCIVSEAIEDEFIFNDNISKIDLSDADHWVDSINSFNLSKGRSNINEKIMDYDVSKTSDEYEIIIDREMKKWIS